ncbi:MAG: hypothetical protein KJ072_13170 [Verrucomicrobia bacterium]|nr:hypothetical protein [Verrucomicrobiota bacterium]
MNTEKSIAIACFTGATLGAVLALQWGYFWWIGVFLGGAVAYFSFRFREGIVAARRVWRSLARPKAAAWRTGIWNVARLTGAVMALLCFGVSILIMIVGVAMSLAVGEGLSFSGQGQSGMSGEAGIAAQYWVIVAAALLFAVVLAVFGVLVAANDRKAACRTILSCFLLTPLVLPFTLAFVIGSALLPRAGRLVVRLAVVGLQAARQLFVLIHSELRVLCMTDAMIGAVAGFFCGHALVGGLIGAVCGLVDYKLVSVRLLKVVKA